MTDIIMTTYNGEKYIEEQIRSILDSDNDEFRLLVYDDMSSDDTPGIVKKFADEYSGKVFFFENEIRYGHCANFLQGLKRAKREFGADYYMFCDQDDIWLKDKIGLSLEIIRELESPDADGNDAHETTPCMVFSDAMLVNTDLEPLGVTFLEADRLDAKRTDLAHLLMENKCQGCTMMFNKVLADMVDEYDERVRYHDWWIALIAAAFGRIGFIDTPTLMYRQHEGNVVGQDSFAGYIKNRIKAGSADTKERLKATRRQAAAFYKYYGRRLPQKERQVVREFLLLPKKNAFARRLTLIKNGYMKSGLIRNAGLMLYI